MSIECTAYLSASFQTYNDPNSKSIEIMNSPFKDNNSIKTVERLSDSMNLKSTVSALSFLLSIESGDKCYQGNENDEAKLSQEELPRDFANTSCSFYGSYQSIGLPEGFNEVQIENLPQPKETESKSEIPPVTLVCGELINALLEYFRGLEAKRGQYMAAELPFCGTVQELIKDNVELLPAENDGSVMDDLPMFSEQTELVNLGLTDFILYDHERDIRIAHIRIEVTSGPAINEEIPYAMMTSKLSLESAFSNGEDDRCGTPASAGDDFIQVFRTDTEENLMAIWSSEKARQGEQDSKLQMMNINSSVDQTIVLGTPGASVKTLISYSSAGKLRNALSSTGLTVSCRRPDSQCWRVTRRVVFSIDPPISGLFDIHSIPMDKELYGASHEAGDNGDGEEFVRMSSNQGAALNQPTHRDEEGELNEYVRKWSENSSFSRQSSLTSLSCASVSASTQAFSTYALNLHTSSATPSFSPSVASKDDEPQFFVSTSIHCKSTRSGSVRSYGTNGIRTLSRSSGSFCSELDSRDLVQGEDPFVDIDYCKPGSHKDVLSALTGPSPRGSLLVDGDNRHLRLDVSDSHALRSSHSESILATIRRAPHDTKTDQSSQSSQQHSFFQRLMSGLFGSGGAPSPHPATEIDKDDQHYHQSYHNHAATSHRHHVHRHSGSSLLSRDNNNNANNPSRIRRRSGDDTIEFHSSRESLGKCLGVVQNLDTGDTFPVGELLVGYSPRRPDPTVSPQAVFGSSRRLLSSKR